MNSPAHMELSPTGKTSNPFPQNGIGQKLTKNLIDIRGIIARLVALRRRFK